MPQPRSTKPRKQVRIDNVAQTKTTRRSPNQAIVPALIACGVLIVMGMLSVCKLLKEGWAMETVAGRALLFEEGDPFAMALREVGA